MGVEGSSLNPSNIMPASTHGRFGKKAEDTKTFVAFLFRLRGSPGLGAPGHDTPGRGAPGLEIQDCTR